MVTGALTAQPLSVQADQPGSRCGPPATPVVFCRLCDQTAEGLSGGWVGPRSVHTHSDFFTRLRQQPSGGRWENERSCHRGHTTDSYIDVLAPELLHWLWRVSPSSRLSPRWKRPPVVGLVPSRRMSQKAIDLYGLTMISASLSSLEAAGLLGRWLGSEPTGRHSGKTQGEV